MILQAPQPARHILPPAHGPMWTPPPFTGVTAELRLACEERGWSAEDLAVYAGLSSRRTRQLLRDRLPDRKDAHGLARAFDSTPDHWLALARVTSQMFPERFQRRPWWSRVRSLLSRPLRSRRVLPPARPHVSSPAVARS